MPWSTTIGRSVFLQATDGGEIVIEPGVTIGTGSRLVAQGGKLAVGKNSFIGPGCVLVCKAGLTIGDDVLIAEYVTIRDQEHRYPIGQKIRESGFDCAPIIIHADVWIGAKASVLKGAHISTGAVIAAHSLVRAGAGVAENTVVAGVPAKFIKVRPNARS